MKGRGWQEENVQHKLRTLRRGFVLTEFTVNCWLVDHSIAGVTSSRCLHWAPIRVNLLQRVIMRPPPTNVSRLSPCTGKASALTNSSVHLER